MASPVLVRVARASVAGLRPRALLVPTLCHSFLRAGVPRQLPVYAARRGYAAEATARAEATPRQASQSAHEDITEETPLFSTLQGKVHPATLKALTVAPFSYKNMSVVQGEVLPLLPGLAEPRQDNPASQDLLVKARTGTGKTLAFLVPAVEARLKQLEAVAQGDPKVGHQYGMDNVGALIISPTRELATQIVQEAQKLTAHHRGWQTSLFVGGLSKNQQLYGFLKSRKDLLVATPGRLRDMLDDPRVAATLKNTKMLVLDEADTLLDMGFRDDIEDIMKFLPNTEARQTLLFSATVSPAIRQIANTHLSPNQRFINCVSEDASPVHDHIPQYHTVIQNQKDQIPHVLRLIFQDQVEHGDKSKVILFLSTTKLTQLMGNLLYRLSNAALPMPRTYTYEIHSKKTMNGRVSASDGFRKVQRASILVTSDVSARGVDYPGVTRVIQLGLPKSPEQYVHRVGRTGRGGSLVGRGDLVVATWENEFVKRNLSHIPLKPLTVKDHHDDVSALVGPKEDGGRPHPASIRYQDLERTTSESLAKLDEQEVSETMMSMLGFYASMTSMLRTNINVIVEELQKWTTEGLGLARAPFVSESMLSRIGGGSRGGNRGRPERSAGGFRRAGEFQNAARSFGQKREWRDDSSSGGFDRPPRQWNSDRPPRREGGFGGGFGGGFPRRNNSFGSPQEGASRPQWNSGRERGEGYQSRRSRSWENQD